MFTKSKSVAQRLFVCATLALAMGSSAFAGEYDSFPTKPVKIIVPFAAGGSMDALARFVGAELEKKWGQAVLVENRSGAGSRIGGIAIARSAPDGYTLGGGTNGFLATGAMDPAAFNPTQGVTVLTIAGTSAYSLVVASNGKFNSVADVVEASKTSQVLYGSSGIGSGSHFVGEMFNMATGAKLKHVPYNGDAPVFTAMISGEIQIAFASPPSVRAAVEAGTLKVLAAAAPERMAEFPDAPTMDEAGVKGFEMPVFWGFWAPQGLPEALADKLADDINAALETPRAREVMSTLGIAPMPRTSRKELSKFVADEVETYSRVAVEIGIQKKN